MGKGKNRKSRDDATHSGNKGKASAGGANSGDASIAKNSPVTTIVDSSNVLSVKKKDGSITHVRNTASRRGPLSLIQWCFRERQGIIWVLGCSVIGGIIGFGIGSGFLTGERGAPNQWRVALGRRIRSSLPYRAITMKISPRESVKEMTSSIESVFGEVLRGDFIREFTERSSAPKLSVIISDPSHPRVFAVLREAIIRERGGYVHPDLGLMMPAPSGASRGLGMVSDKFHDCQIKCFPGLQTEKLEVKNRNATDPANDEPNNEPGKRIYKQEEVLVRVPLAYQMTRSVALSTLLPRIPVEVQRKSSLHELDDAALLVLLLAHERGVGKFSRWLPYLASLPTEPSCGYSKRLRPHMLDSLTAYREELGVDINGWTDELMKATKYSDKIVSGLAKDYGAHILHPKHVSVHENLEWALCTVASRATGGSQKHGALRMIPILDMANHDNNAGSFVELTGKERLEGPGFVDATELDSGTLVIRSLRHGRRKALRKDQELLVNYNVPHYSPLDWFVSLGFIPPERWGQWEKIDSAFPDIRLDR